MSSRRKNPDQDLIYRVMMAGRESGTRAILFQQTVGQLLGLNATDMKCLDVIVRSGPSSPSRLAELTGLTTGAVTILIDRLEGAGVIERRPDPDDRRRTVLVPTQQAMKKIPPYYESMARGMEEIARSYSAQELEVLVDYFNRTSEVFARETEKLRKRLGGGPAKS